MYVCMYDVDRMYTCTNAVCLPGLELYVCMYVVVVVALLFYVHDIHLRSCRDGQLT